MTVCILDFYTFAGWAGTVLSSIELIPQMIQTFVLFSAVGISTLTISMFFFASIAWLIYGIGISSWQIIISSILQLAVASVIVWFKLFDYTRSQTRQIMQSTFEKYGITPLERAR